MKNLFYKILIIFILLAVNSYSASNKTNSTTSKSNYISPEEKKREELKKNLKFWEDTLKYGTITQKITVVNYIKAHNVKEAENLIVKYYDGEKNFKVRKSMIEALISFSNHSAVTYVSEMFKKKNKSKDMKKFLMQAVSELKYKKAYKDILNFLDDENLRIRMQAIRTIGELGVTEVIPTFITNYKTEKNERIKTEYILALARLKSPKAESILLSVFTNADEPELNRSYAATGLGYIQTKKALDTLLRFLPKEKAAIRHRIAAALGYYNEPEVITTLIDLLKDDDKGVRYYAIKSLEKLKAQKAIDALKYKKDYDPEFKIRIEAREALKNITGKTNW